MMKKLDQYHPLTQSLHFRIDDSKVKPVVTPLYQNSAFSADSPYFYTRKNNPNYAELEQVFSILEGSAHVISVTTGMSALSLAIGLLRAGDHLVVNKDIYGCSYKFFKRFGEHRGVKVTVLDLSTDAGIGAIPQDTSMVVFESPTNPFLKTVGIEKVSKRVKAINPHVLIVVDNTWATPFFQKPLNLGADICVYSATKFISGHSDVMGGFISTNHDGIAQRLKDDRFYNGTILDPHSAWLLRRSMYTFRIRMEEHQRVTQEMYGFLQKLPQITKVYHPTVDGVQLTGYACILFCELRDDLVDRYSTFANSLDLFDTGTGMACVTSMIAQPYTGSHASMTDEEKAEMGLGKNLIRLCFGMENVEDLKKDLITALNAIDGQR